MELMRWNPRRELFGLHNSINRMFDNFISPTVRSDEALSVWGWNPVVDIYENEENIVITAELPGVDKKDMTVDVKGRVLTLKGERSTDNEVKEDNYYRKERYHGKFERSFTLPVGVDPDKVEADYKDGVLKIGIPKPEEEKPKRGRKNKSKLAGKKAKRAFLIVRNDFRADIREGDDLSDIPDEYHDNLKTEGVI